VIYTVFVKPAAALKENTTEQNQDIEEYKKYSKSINHLFELDSTEFKVISFEYKIEDNKTNLKIIISIKNKSGNTQILSKDNFKLLSENKTVYLPISEPITLEANSASIFLVEYNLTAKNLPYLAYFLNITKGSEKAIISISKSYRSEG
jgi:hypothetical protein